MEQNLSVIVLAVQIAAIYLIKNLFPILVRYVFLIHIICDKQDNTLSGFIMLIMYKKRLNRNIAPIEGVGHTTVSRTT
jgi:hypothetical protein